MAMNSIVVPIYKPFESLGQEERISLHQLYRVMRDHEIILIGPVGFDFSLYKAHAESFGVGVHVKTFGADFFIGIDGYNKLLLSRQFYRAFLQFEYILIYQTDAYVFKDDLDFWCKQGYDYIGAPWFDGYGYATEGGKFIGVGNGGFSLRKVKSYLKVMSTFRYIVTPSVLWKEFLKNPGIRQSLSLIAKLTFRNNSFSRFSKVIENEDIYWGMVVPSRFPWFKVPDMQTASQFAMEVNAPLLYKQNNSQLPFGCHKWDIYTPAFWEPFIQIEQ